MTGQRSPRVHRDVALTGGAAVLLAREYSIVYYYDPAWYFFDVSWIPLVLTYVILVCGAVALTSLVVRIALTRSDP